MLLFIPLGIIIIAIMIRATGQAAAGTNDGGSSDTSESTIDSGVQTINDAISSAVNVVTGTFDKYDSIILQAAQQYGVEFAVIKAVIGTESSFRETPPVRAGDASYGLMQVTPGTAQFLGFPSDQASLEDPAVSIPAGTAWIAHCQSKCGTTDPAHLYSCYNSGHCASNATQVQTDISHFMSWYAKFQGESGQ